MENNKCDREQVKKIKRIIEREIDKELISKQDEVTNISEKIKTVLRNLELLKYIVAVNYYDQNSTLAPKKNQEDENEEEKTQNQIHPCIKKLMPYRSNYNKLHGETFSNHSYTTRNTKKVNELTSEVIKKETTKNTCESKENVNTSSKIPQYIPPLPNSDENLIKVNSTRGTVSKESYKVVIGNVSKWISPDTREGNSTHKWMVYIRTKDSNKDITEQLRKVRYFLHESYKPHDIIDVTSPPFHLTRRGWGEFPVRVQLHFTHPLNKPVDIIHNLKLDMTCSGIQMLGAETVVNVSLHQNITQNTKDTSKTESEPKITSVKEENVKEKQDIFDGNLLTSLNGIKFSSSDIDIAQENSSGIVIKQEPQDEFENDKMYISKSEDYLANNNNSKYLLDRRKTIKTIEIEHNYVKTVENSVNKNLSDFTDSIFKLEVIKNQIVNEKNSKNGVILDSVQLNQMITKKNQECLNKIELKGNRSEEEVFKNLKAVVHNLETETQSKYSMKIFRNMYMVNIVQRAHATKLKSIESLVKWFVQRWPIVTKLSLDPFYKTIHPYSSPTQEEFLKFNIGKQRSAEWFRAKAIQKVLLSLKSVIPLKEEIWSTKQILLWSRHHGYSPLSFQKIHKTETVETNEMRNKRLKLNESSSDSDESAWEIPDKKSKTSDFFNGISVKDRKKNFKKSRRKESPEVFDRHKSYKNLSTFTESSDFRRFGCGEDRALHYANSDTEIEIIEVEKENVKESPSTKQDPKLTVVTTPSSERLFNDFVCDTAKQIGVKIVEEELIPGVKSDSVLRVLSLSVSNFLEELLRKSFAHAWMRNGERCPDYLELNDILATLIEHNRFDLFTNRGLGISNSEKS